MIRRGGTSGDEKSYIRELLRIMGLLEGYCAESETRTQQRGSESSNSSAIPPHITLPEGGGFDPVLTSHQRCETRCVRDVVIVLRAKHRRATAATDRRHGLCMGSLLQKVDQSLLKFACSTVLGRSALTHVEPPNFHELPFRICT